YRRTPARGARRSGPAQLRGKALYACSLEEERRYAAEGAEQRGREPASRPTRALVGRGERGRRRVRAPLSLATSLLVDARPGLCRPVRAPLPSGSEESRRGVRSRVSPAHDAAVAGGGALGGRGRGALREVRAKAID